MSTTTTTTTTEAEVLPGGEASPNAERQGEVVADQSAETPVLGGRNSGPEEDARVNAENIAGAQQDALRNAQGEQDLRA